MHEIRLSATDSELAPRILARAGITGAEADAWLRSGIPAYQAVGFAEAGFGPGDALELRDAGVTGSEAALAVAAGADPIRLCSLRDHSGTSVREIAQALSAGVDIPTVEAWIGLGFDLLSCAAWIEEGHGVDDVVALAEAEAIVVDAEASLGPSPVAADPESWTDPVWLGIADRLGRDPLTDDGPALCWHPEAWRDAGFGPWAALAWTLVDTRPAEAAEARAEGQRPLDAIGYRLESRPVVLRRGLRGWEWVRADGTPLPKVAARIFALGDPATIGYLLLPALGHVILGWDAEKEES